MISINKIKKNKWIWDGSADHLIEYKFEYENRRELIVYETCIRLASVFDPKN